MILTSTLPIVIAVVLAVLFLLIVWYVATLNSLRRAKVKCEESLSDIDVALTKRYDLLTKLLDTTKGYAKHESETLIKAIEARKGVKEMSNEEKIAFANKLNEVQSGLNVVVERYPELKADSVFKNLQNGISDSEEHLQAARRVYNSNVSLLKQRAVSFPSSIVAKMAHIEVPLMFEAEEAKKQDVKMEF